MNAVACLSYTVKLHGVVEWQRSQSYGTIRNYVKPHRVSESKYANRYEEVPTYVDIRRCIYVTLSY